MFANRLASFSGCWCDIASRSRIKKVLLTILFVCYRRHKFHECSLLVILEVGKSQMVLLLLQPSLAIWFLSRLSCLDGCAWIFGFHSHFDQASMWLRLLLVDVMATLCWLSLESLKFFLSLIVLIISGWNLTSWCSIVIFEFKDWLHMHTTLHLGECVGIWACCKHSLLRYLMWLWTSQTIPIR